MRKTIRLLLLLLLFIAIFPFLYPWKDGKPLLLWSDLTLPEWPSIELPEMPRIPLPGKEETAHEPNQPVKLYRWQGADGSTQFSNELPAQGIAYEVVEVNPDTNLIRAVPTTGTSEEVKPETTGTGPASLPSPLTVSPGEALQLIEDARKLQQLSDERLRQQEALTQ
ncbi:MAG: DUF4124 domain-containing protein [Pseudomonadota bacterium]